MLHEIDQLKLLINMVLKSQSTATPDEVLSALSLIVPAWSPGAITKGAVVAHNGVNYYVATDINAIESQPPDSAGMTAIYRPIPPRDEDGNILFYLPGMNVLAGEKCFADGVLYEAIQQMMPCNWPPDSAGTDAVWRKISHLTNGEKQ